MSISIGASGVRTVTELAAGTRAALRSREELYGITEKAIAIGAKVVWGQIDFHDDAAAKLAEDVGRLFVC